MTAASACLVCALALLVAAALGASAVLLSAIVFVAVISASRVAGVIGGVLSAALGASAIAYFVFPPTKSLRISEMADLTELCVVLVLMLWVAHYVARRSRVLRYSLPETLRSLTTLSRSLLDG